MIDLAAELAAAELWAAAEVCWTGSGCTHDDEAGCADALWRTAKRLKSEGTAKPVTEPQEQTWVCDGCMRTVVRREIADIADGEHVLCYGCVKQDRVGWSG